MEQFNDSPKETTSSTLKLLEQYENHIQEKDRTLDYIEKGDLRFTKDRETGPSYDECFKENVKLRLKVEEYEKEIKLLKELISKLKENAVPVVNYEQQRLEVETPKDPTFSLPPRSADRIRHMKDTSEQNQVNVYDLKLPRSPATFQLNNQNLQEELKTNTQFEKALKNDHAYESTPATASTKKDPQDAGKDNSATTGIPNNILGSPATSVTYTTSRISINSNSPNINNKPHLKRPKSPATLPNGALSPQRANRVTHLINNELHSPLKDQFSDVDKDFVDDTASTSGDDITGSFIQMSPAAQRIIKEDETNMEFSPSSKQNLNKFTDLINKTFGDDDSQIKGPSEKESAAAVRPPVFDPPLPRADSKVLASPVMIQNAANNLTPSGHSFPQKTGISTHDLLKNVSQDNVSAISSSTSIHKSFSPKSVSSLSRIQPPNHRTSSIDMGSPYNGEVPQSDSVLHSPTIISDIPLFVQPEDFSTITVEASSTLYSNPEDASKCILCSVIDKKSSKEMFKFAKSLDQLYELDHMLKIRLMEQYHLPELPKKQLFQATVPVKVDLRRELLTDYLFALFELSNLSPVISLKLAQFISTDTAISVPIGMSDSVKEGVLLVRKTKALGSGNSWKVRQAVIEDQTLLLFDQENLVESIKLVNSTIELQANLPDDKYGTKNGFILNEPKKSGLSSTSRHYFGAETAKQREEWISALIKVCSNSVANIKADTLSSAQDQGSISDASVDTSSSAAIGPMVNLEMLGKSQQVEPATTEMDRETKRNRMRSFFPFKKNQPQLSTSSLDITKESDETSAERSFASALHGMNLHDEAITNVVFGSDIKHCLSLSSRVYQNTHEIPTVVYRCLEYLYKNRAINEEGIFRLSGSSALIKTLQEQFDKEYDVNLCEYNASHEGSLKNGPYLDVNTVAGLLKLYFRRLPHLIFGDDMYEECRVIAERNSGKPTETALQFKELVSNRRFEMENYSLMFVLFELLMKINENNKVNKMNLRNLCIVFSPTLNIPVNILQPFVEDFQCIFNGSDPVNNDDRQNINLQIPQM
ncbi:Bem3 [Kluyveromyces lactis]|nr:Bem3 [Kluyveromyces lactis]